MLIDRTTLQISKYEAPLSDIYNLLYRLGGSHKSYIFLYFLCGVLVCSSTGAADSCDQAALSRCGATLRHDLFRGRAGDWTHHCPDLGDRTPGTEFAGGRSADGKADTCGSYGNFDGRSTAGKGSAQVLSNICTEHMPPTDHLGHWGAYTLVPVVLSVISDKTTD